MLENSTIDDRPAGNGRIVWWRIFQPDDAD